MAHAIETSKNGKSEIAYVGDVPWHGLGQKLNGGESLDQWRVAAGLDWSVKAYPVTTQVEDETISLPTKRALVRSDNRRVFEVVSTRYQIVQPEEIMAFYDDLIRSQGFKMHTAGALKGGQVIWALAEVGEHFILPGKDRVDNFLLLTTSFDKSSATRAQFTSVRVVCNNTLRYSLEGGINFVSIAHNKKFDADDVKSSMNLRHQGWADFQQSAAEMVKVDLSEPEALNFIIGAVGEEGLELDDQKHRQSIINIFNLYNGQGKGSQLKSSANTLWGALNAITEFQDWHKGRAADTRMSNAWLGTGSQLKARAFNQALELMAA